MISYINFHGKQNVSPMHPFIVFQFKNIQISDWKLKLKHTCNSNQFLIEIQRKKFELGNIKYIYIRAWARARFINVNGKRLLSKKWREQKRAKFRPIEQLKGDLIEFSSCSSCLLSKWHSTSWSVVMARPMNSNNEWHVHQTHAEMYWQP